MSNIVPPDPEKLKALYEIVTTQWQTMASAPKDETRILGYGELGFEREAGIGTVKWNGQSWICDPSEATEYSPEPCRLLYWMSLPFPPEQV